MLLDQGTAHSHPAFQEGPALRQVAESRCLSLPFLSPSAHIPVAVKARAHLPFQHCRSPVRRKLFCSAFRKAGKHMSSPVSSLCFTKQQDVCS